MNANPSSVLHVAAAWEQYVAHCQAAMVPPTLWALPSGFCRRRGGSGKVMIRGPLYPWTPLLLR